MLSLLNTRQSHILSYVACVQFVAIHIFLEENTFTDALAAATMEEGVWFSICLVLCP